MTRCLLCEAETVEHAHVIVRGKHPSIIRRCLHCGFMFLPNPDWLAEAYADPINRSDTGYVWRNFWERDKMRDCIEAQLNPDGIFLDYAAGYGLFVRLMRDAGYDFRWSDLYCQNLFSRGFEAPQPLAGPFEAVTAFEVFEHLTNPNEEIKKLLGITECLIFSTQLLPEPAPLPGDWAYYALEHGQHVAFYSRRSLEWLAKKFGCYFATSGTDLHILSRKPIVPDIFSKRDHRRWRFWDKREPARKSLTEPDHDFIVKELLSNQKSS